MLRISLFCNSDLHPARQGCSSIFVKLPKTPQTLNLPRFSQRRAAWAFFFLPVSSQIMPKSAPGTVFCHEILDFDLEASRHGGCSSIFVKILEASQTVPHFSQGSAASCHPGHPHTQLVGQNPRPERRFVTKLPISALKRLSSDLNNLLKSTDCRFSEFTILGLHPARIWLIVENQFVIYFLVLQLLGLHPSPVWGLGLMEADNKVLANLRIQDHFSYRFRIASQPCFSSETEH